MEMTTTSKKFTTKKSLGQNWLANPGALDKIVKAAEISNGDTVIEIGPGTGNLTRKLIKAGAKVIVIEKDHRLINQLRSEFPEIEVIESDVLKLDIGELIKNSKLEINISDYKVIGNIPYYITSHLIRQILEKWPKPNLIALTIQKEVAQRIVSKPPKMNLLAISVQFYAEPKIIGYLAPGKFRPAPKVDSAIIKLIPKEKIYSDREKFFKILRAGFSSKRKMLINNLVTKAGLNGNEIREAFEKLKIDPNTRAENLILEQWLSLTNLLRL
jgi:16S rRNA (adenine1518-N6/adenine1519-N6)-dimethyltransferase